MNTRQLQYAVLLAEERNFSQIAKKLNITQPALSKQILGLEAELGVKLFDRSSLPLKLTAAGKHFVREAKELLYKEEQLIKSMDYYKSGEAGNLVIGITPFRSFYMISDVIKRIREKYPKITVSLKEAGSDVLRKGVAEGRYDFAIVNLPVDESVLDVKLLEPDRLVLAVPEALSKEMPRDEIDFKDCLELPFIVLGEGQEMRILFDKLCAAAGFVPRIAAEVVGLTTAWTVAKAGVGATILPWQFVKEHKGDGLCFIKIKDAVYTRQPVIVTRRDQYISDAAAYAMDLLTK
ncbi:MAG: LysR family transcriptional regulator [Ruminococcaceae bacterium]|nr:LysR family transcriptional regulator [Oscillospiraceae bacterium]